jgi:hypothetical protein
MMRVIEFPLIRDARYNKVETAFSQTERVQTNTNHAHMCRRCHLYYLHTESRIILQYLQQIGRYYVHKLGHFGFR